MVESEPFVSMTWDSNCSLMAVSTHWVFLLWVSVQQEPTVLETLTCCGPTEVPVQDPCNFGYTKDFLCTTSLLSCAYHIGCPCVWFPESGLVPISDFLPDRGSSQSSRPDQSDQTEGQLIIDDRSTFGSQTVQPRRCLRAKITPSAVLECDVRISRRAYVICPGLCCTLNAEAGEACK